MSTPGYEKWKTEPTPENMATVIAELDPMINAEIHRYPGPKPLLRGRARRLALDAVRSYDPASGAQLRSWVTTQLQPLSRYSNTLKPIKLPEVAVRQAAEVHRLDRELADEMGHNPTDEELADHSGISVRRIQAAASWKSRARSSCATQNWLAACGASPWAPSRKVLPPTSS